MFLDEDLVRIRDLPLTLSWDGITENELGKLGFVRARHADGLKGMIACLVVAAHIDLWVSYSRNKEFYRGSTLYGDRNYTYRKIIDMVETLLDLGLIEEQRAKKNGFGTQSRMRASPRLLKLGQSFGPFKCRACELIRLRNAIKEPLEYEETRRTFSMREQLNRHNTAIAALEIGLKHPVYQLNSLAAVVEGNVIIPARRHLYRVFNVDWDHGGRLYGAFWQLLPSDVRRSLTINGERVSEPDFRHLHPHLLYASFGRDLDFDAYTIDGFDRGLCKVAFQMLINCDNRRSALGALQREGRSQANTAFSKSDAARLLTLMEGRHKAIRHALYTGVGRRLQNIDSELMLRVMDRCLDNGITGLPVHDSLIVRASEEESTSRIMRVELDHTLECLNRIGFQGLINGHVADQIT